MKRGTCTAVCFSTWHTRASSGLHVHGANKVHGVLCGYACRWVPSSARFVALGSYARNTGCFQVRVCAAQAKCPLACPLAALIGSEHRLLEQITCFLLGLQIYELDGPDLKLITEVEKPSAFKCGTFGASSLVDRHMATGNFGGKLQLWDLERLNQPVFEVQAHASIVNQMDGFGGQVRSRKHSPRSATAPSCIQA